MNILVLVKNGGIKEIKKIKLNMDPSHWVWLSNYINEDGDEFCFFVFIFLFGNILLSISLMRLKSLLQQPLM